MFFKNFDNFSNLLESPLSNNTVSKNGQLISSEINDVNYSYNFDEKATDYLRLMMSMTALQLILRAMTISLET